MYVACKGKIERVGDESCAVGFGFVLGSSLLAHPGFTFNLESHASDGIVVNYVYSVPAYLRNWVDPCVAQWYK